MTTETVDFTEEQEEAIEHILKGAELLGWDMAFKNGDADSAVEYFIIGMTEAVDALLEKLESE